MDKQADIVIIGSGLSALQLACHLRSLYHVIIITKTTIRQSNSYLAQGGIAAVIDKNDSMHSHIEDTLKAGRYHHSMEGVERLVKEGAQAVKEMIADGFMIDRKEDGTPSFGLEGAHSRKRIIHSGGDATGKQAIEHLLRRLPPNVELVEGEMAYECLLDSSRNVCIGVKTKDAAGNVHRYFAPHIVLATGGAGSVYPFTSNAPTATGDGIAMAFRAGAEVADMEFVQFHPTLLFVNGKTRGLISEAVRGAGARIVDEDGCFLMEKVHPQKDLAPRHVTAFEIYRARMAGKSVYLDIRSIPAFREQFPTITALCEENGISIGDGRIPVAPGSHFLMGGISVDINGRTTVRGLYAIGETSYSGVHGANRLASNSLLEGLVAGQRLAAFLNRSAVLRRQPSQWFHYSEQLSPREAKGLMIKELQKKMMEAVGVIRDKETMERHLHELEARGWKRWIRQGLDLLSIEEIEYVNMYITSYLISRGALIREESRGAHIRMDFCEEREAWSGQKIVQTTEGIKIRGERHERDTIGTYA